MSDDVACGLARVEELLRRQIKLQAAAILQSELKGDFEQQLYALTGTAKREQITKRLKCGSHKVAEYWARWEQLGLLVKGGNGYQKVS